MENAVQPVASKQIVICSLHAGRGTWLRNRDSLSEAKGHYDNLKYALPSIKGYIDKYLLSFRYSSNQQRSRSIYIVFLELVGRKMDYFLGNVSHNI